MEKDDIILIAVIAVVLSGIIGYFIGGRTQNQKQSSVSSPFSNNRFGRFENNQSSNSQNSKFQNTNSMAGPRQVMGEIISQDDKSITVKMPDGGSKIIFTNDKTQISKSTIATKADLKTGEKIIVFGPENSDGSVTADNIQLNPQIKIQQQ